MSTSGTINNTRINTSKLLDKAIRRCGLLPAVLSPEIAEQCLESLFMFMTSLASRGLNLWCVDHQLLGLTPGKGTYVLPAGTLDLLNILQSTHFIPDGTSSTTATEYTWELTAQASVVRYGVQFKVAPAAFNFETSSDGITWTTVQVVTGTFVAGEVYWYDLDPIAAAQYFRIKSAGQTVTQFYLSTRNLEIPVTPFNRDDYMAQPNKAFQSQTPLNYFYEKLVTPQLTLWPIPSDGSRCLSFYRYRQIQDIGALTDEIEIPMRWYEHVTWQLSLRLAFELPGVDPARLQQVQMMAAQFEIEAESGEGDGAPVYYAPNIGVYTR